MSEEKQDKPVSPVLPWIDFETTGTEDHAILLEVALVITDNGLNELGHYSSVIIDVDVDMLVPDNQPRTDEFQIPCWSQHWETGLIDDLKSAMDDDRPLPTLGEVENLIIDLMNAHGIHDKMPEQLPPLCGSTVSFDRRFLKKYMPNAHELLCHRNIDVSSIRELQKRWRPDLPDPPKFKNHRALQDIRESIGYLKHFRDKGFICI